MSSFECGPKLLDQLPINTLFDVVFIKGDIFFDGCDEMFLEIMEDRFLSSHCGCFRLRE